MTLRPTDGNVAGTTPYPWPFDDDLDPSRAALVVAGWDEAWWRRAHEPGRIVPSVLALAEAVGFVVVVEHRPATVPARLSPPAGSGGPPSVPGAHVVTSAGVDGFYGGPLDALLRAAGRDHLYIAGLGLETAVHSTLRTANDRGLECLLVVDACAPLNPDAVAPAVSMIEMSGGIFGAVGTTESVLAALAATRPPGGAQ